MLKTLEDYISKYDLVQLPVKNYYMFKNPGHYPICGSLFAYSTIAPNNVFAATHIFATETCIEYFGWERIYPEEYEEYFAQMKSEFNSAIIDYKSHKIEQKLSNIQKDF